MSECALALALPTRKELPRLRQSRQQRLALPWERSVSPERQSAVLVARGPNSGFEEAAEALPDTLLLPTSESPQEQKAQWLAAQ